MPETTVRFPRLMVKTFHSVAQIKGPLVILDAIDDVGFNELVEIIGPDGTPRFGRVLSLAAQRCVVQVFSGTSGLDLAETCARPTGSVARINVARAMLGRALNSRGEAIDGGPEILAEDSLDINGLPINPSVRTHPSEFIETGISAIDGLNSLTRGQKLPIFSGAGLPSNQLAAQIAAQARVRANGSGSAGGIGNDGDFAVVFAAIGITHREAAFFRQQFEASGSFERTVLFLNHADDPTIERILTPRAALTAAEYLAFTHHLHVLVILTDLTNYCEALREVSAACEDIPGRRGYPGYLYSDLASLYERAGRIRGVEGSLTQLILLTMPDDDITHPIPDLTGYITEGQIVLSRELHHKGIYPPIDVLPSLSRLMSAGIGPGKTRADHRVVSDQLYAIYAQGRDLRRLVAIVGEAALSPEDRAVLAFADRFERELIGQGSADRSIEATLALAWKLLSMLPRESLKRIPEEVLKDYYAKE
jgi:V/A-type H+/Na+-transporting ATPase subunit B